MDESDLRVDQRVRRSMRGVVREALITGLAVVVPLIITAIVLATALQYVHSYLSFVSENLSITGRIQTVPLLGQDVKLDALLVEVLTPVVLLVVIFVVGLFVSTTTVGERAVDYFDSFISRIPAVGGIYDSFRQMSDVVLESDVRNFRDVKLVEFPHDGAYTLGFVTTQTPEQLSGPTRHPEMLTLFLPLAPNPVMGGHLVHMPRDKVIDVDMTVEEGIRAVVTSGVAVADADGAGASSLSADDLKNLTGTDPVDGRGAAAEGAEETEATADDGREAAYREANADPSEAPTPDDIAGRNRTDDRADGATDRGTRRDPQTPAEAAGRDPGEADPTGAPPDEHGRDPADREPTGSPPAETARDPSARESIDGPPAETTSEGDEDAPAERSPSTGEESDAEDEADG